ncbi:MAG TPA: OmpA family protein [Bacteroidales bacterium]|nr:OmpA family protein [Bacteroidales bacterium]
MRTVLLLFVVSLFQLSVYAQQKTPDELKESFNDAGFFLAQEAYVDALYDYSELYNNGFNTNANINYRIGICYLNIPGQKEKSINYLLEAVKDVSKKYNESSLKQKSAPIDAWLFLGNAYRVNDKLTDAIAAYNHYKELATTPAEIVYADQQITACQTAQRFIENGKNIRFTNLGDSVNGPSSNLKGVVSGNGRVLLYMNELPFYTAVYFSTYTGQGWSSPVNITPQIQSDGDQFVTSVSYDGTQLLLTKEDPFNSDIYISHYKDGIWSRSFPVAGEDINTKFWESHACLSKDGKTLFFTSNRKDGSGNMDIYKSVLRGSSWDKPVNLGPSINTALNEDTPFISENDSLLFFSSQGHENMGGYDIFVSKLDASGAWTKPENLGYPVNTTDDDLFYFPWRNNEVGFLSRIRDGGYGKEDIYALQSFDDKEFEVILAELSSENKTAVPETIIPEIPANEQVIAEPEKTNVPATPPITAEPSEAAKPFETTQPAIPAKVSAREIELEPVYFAFDNFQLNETAKKQLEKVKGYLMEYPGTHVKLIGHADAKGPADYNLKLSEKRATVAKEYLVSGGIDAARIESMGLGEKNFAAVNSNADGSDNPEGRRLNRRVEYEIIGTENSPIIIRMTPIPENLKYRQ